MNLTKYDYIKSAHVGLLTDEIDASDIVTAHAYNVVDGSTLSVWFKDALSISDKLILDGIVAVHDETAYVAPTKSVQASFMREEDDSKIPFVYASPRPMNHYSYFTSCGDGPSGLGTGDRLLFDMATTDSLKTIDVQFNEHTYLKDGLIMCKNAPFGAVIDIDIIHPSAGYLLSFGRGIPAYGDFPINLNTEDRASVPAGLIIRVTVHNSTGVDGDDPAAAFKVFGRLEMYRPKPAGI